MKFVWFNLMPWPHMPDDFREKHRSVWVDIDQDLYDRPARLAFQARLRPEQTFPGAEALVAQIRQDVERGRAALGAAGIPDAI